MVDDSECFVLWAMPQWEQWAEFEKAQPRRRRRSSPSGVPRGS